MNFPLLVTMGISERVRRTFSLKKPGRKAPSNYEPLIPILSAVSLGDDSKCPA